MTNDLLKVNCPTCKKIVVWEASNTYRPFCSERCQQIDLGAWANEEYNIPARNQDEWSETQKLSESDHTIQ